MEICQGVALHVLPSEKFKDIGFFVRFLQPLKEESAGVYSLLALMMSDRLQAYPTKQAMSEYLDTMYGAMIGAQTIGYGKGQVLELRMKLLHPRFADSDDFLEKGIAFLKEMITRPLLNEECLQEAKRVLLAKLQRMRDDASQYVVSQGLKLAGAQEALGISALGEASCIDAITLADIQNAHRQLLTESGVDMIVCGDLSEETITALLLSHFDWQPRNVHVATHYAIDHTRPYEEVREKRDIPQSSIMQVYFTHTDITDADYYALRVMNAMLGQYSTSLLFQNVREKNSLCYSIYSSLIAFDAALGIMTGVEKKDIDRALDLIKAQVAALQAGDFEDELLAVSKTMIAHSLRSGDDHMNTLAALQYQNDLLGRNDTSADIIAHIEHVTRSDVIRAAKRLEHKATYIVMNEEAENETDHQ